MTYTYGNKPHLPGLTHRDIIEYRVGERVIRFMYDRDCAYLRYGEHGLARSGDEIFQALGVNKYYACMIGYGTMPVDGGMPEVERMEDESIRTSEQIKRALHGMILHLYDLCDAYNIAIGRTDIVGAHNSESIERISKFLSDAQRCTNSLEELRGNAIMRALYPIRGRVRRTSATPTPSPHSTTISWRLEPVMRGAIVPSSISPRSRILSLPKESPKGISFEKKDPSKKYCELCDKPASIKPLMSTKLSVCEECVHAMFICSLCRQPIEGRNIQAVNIGKGLYECAYCANDHGRVGIQRHSYKPSPLFFSENYMEGGRYFGIELEIESPRRDPNDVIHKRNKREIYFKKDGSLQCGVEIVTHPMTYEYIKTHKDFFTSLLKDFDREKCKSNDTETCGMHIHVSKDSVSTLQLYKALEFFRKYRVFVYAMSGRTSHAQVNRYASLGKITKGAAKCMSKKYWDGADKYTAINILPSQTIEFRIFKGTLNPRVFFKNIEFVQALLEWCKVVPLDNVKLSSFSDYVRENAKKYANLNWYMKEKSLFRKSSVRRVRPVRVDL